MVLRLDLTNGTINGSKRDKAYSCWNGAKMLNTFDNLRTLDARSEPYVGSTSEIFLLTSAPIRSGRLVRI